MVIFRPKIQICVYFGGPWNGKGWYILWPLGIFYGYLVYLMAVWNSLWSFPILVCWDQEKSGNPDSHWWDFSLWNQQPILRLLNLQLQRQRCSRLDRFYIRENILYSKNELCYWLRCKFYNAGVVTHSRRIGARVSRWYIFIPTIPIWVNFGVPRNGKYWYMLWPIAIFYGNFVYFMNTW
jgi:hypothetical protein